MIDQAVRDRNLQNPADKAAAVEETLPFVRAVSGRIQKREYFDIAMDSLRVQKDQRRELWQQVRGGASTGRAGRSESDHAARIQPTVAEEKLLGLLVASDELRNIMLPRLEPTDYEALATSAIFRAIAALGKEDKEISFDSLSEATADNSMAAEFLPRLLMNEPAESFDESLADANSCLNALRLMKLDRDIDELSAQIADADRAGENDERDRLAMKKLELSKQRSTFCRMAKWETKPAAQTRLGNINVAIEEKDRDDVMDRLLQLGGDKKFLSYDDLNRELPENVVSPDDIEDVLQKLDASNIHVADSDERLIEQAAAIATDDDESDEDLELDLSAGALEKTNDPVRLYLREMGVVLC